MYAQEFQAVSFLQVSPSNSVAFSLYLSQVTHAQHIIVLDFISLSQEQIKVRLVRD
jgi:hypothetical protein